ncbi:MAG: hypothetical protein JNN11_03845 [Candidatus Doudnabacteria bacterium]|nr:hypothetical protein [Candidatus Doudnabacteria bacterium]
MENKSTSLSENESKIKRLKSFWPMVVVALVSALVGGSLVWALYNQSVEEEINSLMPGVNFKLRHKGAMKSCPENWYENKMPGMSDSSEPNEYYVYKGQRKELSEFDRDWVKNNCELEKEVVY